MNDKKKQNQFKGNGIAKNDDFFKKSKYDFSSSYCLSHTQTHTHTLSWFVVLCLFNEKKNLQTISFCLLFFLSKKFHKIFFFS